MSYMRESLIFIRDHLKKTAKETGLSRNKLMQKAGFDSSQWRSYVRADRPLSDPMLKGLSELPGWPEYAVLLKMKAEDKNPELAEINEDLDTLLDDLIGKHGFEVVSAKLEALGAHAEQKLKKGK